MSENFVIKRSAIHGRGLFATRSFVPGEVVGVYDGEETSVDGRYVLWIIDEDGTELGIKGRNAIRYVNHSATPNCEFISNELAAIELIQAGHELTCHYGPDWI